MTGEVFAEKTPEFPLGCGVDATAYMLPPMLLIVGLCNGGSMKKDLAGITPRKAYQKPTLTKAAVLTTIAAGSPTSGAF